MRVGPEIFLVALAAPALIALGDRRYGAGLGWALFAICAGTGFAAIRFGGPTWLIASGLLCAFVIPILIGCIALYRRLTGRPER